MSYELLEGSCTGLELPSSRVQLGDPRDGRSPSRNANLQQIYGPIPITVMPASFSSIEALFRSLVIESAR